MFRFRCKVVFEHFGNQLLSAYEIRSTVITTKYFCFADRRFTIAMLRSTSIGLTKVAYRYATATGYDARLVVMTILFATWVFCGILIYCLTWIRCVAGGGLIAMPALYMATRRGHDDDALTNAMETFIHQIERPDNGRTRFNLEPSYEQALRILEADVVLD